MAPRKRSGGEMVKSDRQARYEKRVERRQVAECGVFTLFPKLPPELRLMIWNATIVPRILYIHSRLFVEASVPVPAMLHVCKESRTEALKKYKPVAVSNFSLSNDQLRWLNSRKGPFYTSEIDVLYSEDIHISALSMFSRACTAMNDYPLGRNTERGKWSVDYIIHEIRRAAITHDGLQFSPSLPTLGLRNHQHLARRRMEQIFKWKNLDELIVVIGQGDRLSRWSQPDIEPAVKFTEDWSSVEETDYAKEVEEGYRALIKREQEKRGGTWKAPTLVVKRLGFEKKEPREVTRLRS